MGTTIAGGGGEDELNNQNPSLSSSSLLLSVPSSDSITDPLKTSHAHYAEEEEDEEFEWVAVDRDSDIIITDTKSPETDEVENAFSALQLLFNDNDDKEDRVSDSGLLIEDWIEPPLQLCNTSLLQPYMVDRLYDAFHLFQTDPSVQRMVMSLASDKAVWDAVMSNEVVRELVANAEMSEDDSGCCSAASFVRKLFKRSAVRIIDAMEKVTKYVTDIFNVVHGDDETVVLASGTAPMMEKLQLTVLLAVIVLLIVLVTRPTRGR